MISCVGGEKKAYLSKDYCYKILIESLILGL